MNEASICTVGAVCSHKGTGDLKDECHDALPARPEQRSKLCEITSTRSPTFAVASNGTQNSMNSPVPCRSMEISLLPSAKVKFENVNDFSGENCSKVSQPTLPFISGGRWHTDLRRQWNEVVDNHWKLLVPQLGPFRNSVGNSRQIFAKQALPIAQRKPREALVSLVTCTALGITKLFWHGLVGESEPCENTRGLRTRAAVKRPPATQDNRTHSEKLRGRSVDAVMLKVPSSDATCCWTNWLPLQIKSSSVLAMMSSTLLLCDRG